MSQIGKYIFITLEDIGIIYTFIVQNITEWEDKLHIHNSAMKRLFGKLLAVFGLALALSTQAQASGYDCKVLLYSIEVRDQAVVFRVTHPFGKTDFKPSAVLEEQLLKAARSSKHIEIRGRTDAEFDNAVDRDIAMQRALRARRYLISNGIDASKIRWSCLAAGGYVTANKTAEGRAKNRRVEIETMDVDASAFNSQVQTKVGSAK